MGTSGASVLPVLCLLLLAEGVFCTKILILAPTASFSHQLPFHIVTRALLERGHHITLLTTDSPKINHENYTEIDASHSYKPFREKYDWAKAYAEPPTKTVMLYSEAPELFAEAAFNHSRILEVARSGEKFDLVIIERLPYQSMYGVWHAVGSPPLIGITTLTAAAPVYTSSGNPMNPAYVPEVWLGYSDQMTFWERMFNTYFYVLIHYVWFWDSMPRQDRLLRKYFGSEPPSIYETERNFSLLIFSNHFCLEYPRPHIPNIIEITGIHVETKTKPLPEKIRKFLDGAEHGVIYMSLGSNVMSSLLPKEKQRAFIEAFRELPQRILWKWETDTVPDQSENLMVGKWLPQQDILAHPKIRLFITQGGLQSMNEATYHAVPFLVIPFFSDQAHNAEKIARAGVGVRLELVDVTKDRLLRDIRTVLDDRKYKDNIRQLSAVFRDHKERSISDAVWWIEYVIRHNGARHMRSAAVDMPWWQLLLLDVVGFVLLVVATVTTAVYLVLRKAVDLVAKRSRKPKAA